MLIILKEYMQFHMLCFVDGIAFNLSVQSEAGLSPGFVQVGNRKMRWRGWAGFDVDSLIDFVGSVTWIKTGSAIPCYWDAGELNI